MRPEQARRMVGLGVVEGGGLGGLIVHGGVWRPGKFRDWVGTRGGMEGGRHEEQEIIIKTSASVSSFHICPRCSHLILFRRVVTPLGLLRAWALHGDISFVH